MRETRKSLWKILKTTTKSFFRWKQQKDFISACEMNLSLRENEKKKQSDRLKVPSSGDDELGDRDCDQMMACSLLSFRLMNEFSISLHLTFVSFNSSGASLFYVMKPSGSCSFRWSSTSLWNFQNKVSEQLIRIRNFRSTTCLSLSKFGRSKNIWGSFHS